MAQCICNDVLGAGDVFVIEYITCQLRHPLLLIGVQLQLHQDVELCERVNIHPHSEDVDFKLVA